MSKQIASFALILTNSAHMPTDDQTQTNIAVVKSWLQDIVKGHLVVGKPVAEDKPVEATPAPVEAPK